MPGKSREEAKEYVLKMAKEHDVKFIWLWFTDILGNLKSFAITVEELEERWRKAWASTAHPSRVSPA
jgi:glutamine synthetase